MYFLKIHSINQWLNQSRSCPTCRTTASKAVVLFFDGADLDSSQVSNDVGILKVQFKRQKYTLAKSRCHYGRDNNGCNSVFPALQR